MSVLIDVRNVFKIYKAGDHEIRALDDISLTVEKGEFTSVIGQSGSGKTTLMHMLGCLDIPDRGEYFLNGKDVLSLNDKRLSSIRNLQIGFVFQGFNLISGFDAYENVELPLIYRGLSSAKRRELCLEALERVGLKDRVKHKPSQLSGGQQQRVAIARAIASRPPVILADEPTGNLDSQSGTEIMKTLQELNSEGETILLITHDNKIASYSSRVLTICDGKITSDIKNEN